MGSGHRSSRRETSGPRSVESNSGRDRHQRSSGRRLSRESDDAEKHCSGKAGSQRTPKKDTCHRRKHSERLIVKLDVIGHPASTVQLGVPVNLAVLLSLDGAQCDRTIDESRYDTSRLFAVTSLLGDDGSGRRVPLEAGLLGGHDTLDSVHPIPDHYLPAYQRAYPSRVILGFFKFSELVIKQPGAYRIRTSLVRMCDEGATSLAIIDSELVKVEGRSSNSHRRVQRVYS